MLLPNELGSEDGIDLAAVDGNEETVEICNGTSDAILELLLVTVDVAFTRRLGGFM